MNMRFEDLGFKAPGFVHSDITIREIALIADLDITEYLDRMDAIWVAAIYPTHHEQIVDNLWDGHPLEMLVAGSYEQHAFNFIMSATIGWSKKTVSSLSQLVSSGNLLITNEPGKVLPFVRH